MDFRSGLERDRHTAWLELIRSKNSVTRFEPLGGSISFDTDADWYFDPNALTLESFTGKYDFFSVAQHEVGRALGFIAGSEAFVANTSNGTYIGAKATALYGGPIALGVDGSHWADGVTFQGAQPAMTPAIPTNTRAMFSPLASPCSRISDTTLRPPWALSA